jgi:hypothetical protein
MNGCRTKDNAIIGMYAEEMGAPPSHQQFPAMVEVRPAQVSPVNMNPTPPLAIAPPPPAAYVYTPPAPVQFAPYQPAPQLVYTPPAPVDNSQPPPAPVAYTPPTPVAPGGDSGGYSTPTDGGGGYDSSANDSDDLPLDTGSLTDDSGDDTGGIDQVTQEGLSGDSGAGHSSTETSTKAYTSGNITTTGGAGDGATTTVHIHQHPKGKGMSGTMQPTDIQVGMVLRNDTQQNIPLYDSVDASGDPAFAIAPGGLIGTVTAIGNGTDGYIYAVTSPQIQAAAPIIDDITEALWNNTFGQLDPKIVITENATVKWADLATLTDTQIQTQAAAIKNSSQNTSSNELIDGVPNIVTVGLGSILGIFLLKELA